MTLAVLALHLPVVLALLPPLAPALVGMPVPDSPRSSCYYPGTAGNAVAAFQGAWGQWATIIAVARCGANC